MSSGAASSSGRPGGFARVAGSEPCPCGSGASFDGCCGPVHRGIPASSPEILMRSRYSAFVVGDAAHLLATWHPGTRPETLTLDPAQRWTGLQIVHAPAASERRGTVEFRARWRHGADSGELHELSRFVRQSERWWYLDGIVD